MEIVFERDEINNRYKIVSVDSVNNYKYGKKTFFQWEITSMTDVLKELFPTANFISDIPPTRTFADILTAASFEFYISFSDDADEAHFLLLTTNGLII